MCFTGCLLTYKSTVIESTSIDKLYDVTIIRSPYKFLRIGNIVCKSLNTVSGSGPLCECVGSDSKLFRIIGFVGFVA